MQGLLTRAFTGGIFVGVIIASIYMGKYTFVLLFALITALCLWEFLNLVLIKDRKRDFLRKVIGVGLGLLPFILAALLQLDLIQNREAFVGISAFLVFPFIFMAFIYELYTRSEQPFVNLAFLVLGMVYIGIPFGLLEFIAFGKEAYYANIVMGLLLMNWGNSSKPSTELL